MEVQITDAELLMGKSNWNKFQKEQLDLKKLSEDMEKTDIIPQSNRKPRSIPPETNVILDDDLSIEDFISHQNGSLFTADDQFNDELLSVMLPDEKKKEEEDSEEAEDEIQQKLPSIASAFESSDSESELPADNKTDDLMDDAEQSVSLEVSQTTEDQSEVKADSEIKLMERGDSNDQIDVQSNSEMDIDLVEEISIQEVAKESPKFSRIKKIADKEDEILELSDNESIKLDDTPEQEDEESQNEKKRKKEKKNKKHKKDKKEKKRRKKEAKMRARAFTDDDVQVGIGSDEDDDEVDINDVVNKDDDEANNEVRREILGEKTKNSGNKEVLKRKHGQNSEDELEVCGLCEKGEQFAECKTCGTFICKRCHKREKHGHLKTHEITDENDGLINDDPEEEPEEPEPESDENKEEEDEEEVRARLIAEDVNDALNFIGAIRGIKEGKSKIDAGKEIKEGGQKVEKERIKAELKALEREKQEKKQREVLESSSKALEHHEKQMRVLEEKQKPLKESINMLDKIMMNISDSEITKRYGPTVNHCTNTYMLRITEMEINTIVRIIFAVANETIANHTKERILMELLNNQDVCFYYDSLKRKLESFYNGITNEIQRFNENYRTTFSDSLKNIKSRRLGSSSTCGPIKLNPAIMIARYLVFAVSLAYREEFIKENDFDRACIVSGQKLVPGESFWLISVYYIIPDKDSKNKSQKRSVKYFFVKKNQENPKLYLDCLLSVYNYRNFTSCVKYKVNTWLKDNIITVASEKNSKINPMQIMTKMSAFASDMKFQSSLIEFYTLLKKVLRITIG